MGKTDLKNGSWNAQVCDCLGVSGGRACQADRIGCAKQGTSRNQQKACLARVSRARGSLEG